MTRRLKFKWCVRIYPKTALKIKIRKLSLLGQYDFHWKANWQRFNFFPHVLGAYSTY